VVASVFDQLLQLQGELLLGLHLTRRSQLEEEVIWINDARGVYLLAGLHYSQSRSFSTIFI
jgi:hypothetical protein